MRAWRSRLALLVGIGLLPLEITFIIALWPYLSIMGKAAIGLFVVGCVCGSIWIIALAYHQIALMRIRRQREYFSSEESAPVGEDGIDHWRILELAGKGMDLRSVALACNTSYYHVQRITSTWKKKLEAS